eukprot:m.483048 g.483048  ORF g.483048 m.483048 type:complete len:402 (-) comp22753_c0_seq1:32-1237(-)
MSLRLLPVAVFNLGGEMSYVLDERLIAQGIPADRASQVRVQIVKAMFHPKFMDEIFRCQEMYTLQKLYSVFERICHASIMRLNASSMSKLFDLMVMSFKHQVVLCTHARELLGITLNHLDGIEQMVSFAPDVAAIVQKAQRRFVQAYGSNTHGQLAMIRQAAMSLLQDKHTKVSLFLQRGIQDNSGRFCLPLSGPVPPGSQPPGQICRFDITGQQSSQVFSVGSYAPAGLPGSLAETGNRGTDLGKNLFRKSIAATIPAGPGTKNVGSTPAATPKSSAKSSSAPPPAGDRTNSYSTAENAVHGLDFLSQMVGVDSLPEGDVFKMNLFGDDDDATGNLYASSEPSKIQGPKANKITIEAQGGTQHSEALSQIMGEMDLGGASTEDASAVDADDNPFDLLDTI